MEPKRKRKRIMKHTLIISFMAAMILLAINGITQASDTAASGRKISNAYQNAVVKVETVAQVKILMNGSEMQNREFKNEITGTVIDPSGLALVSLTAIDPSRFVDHLMRGTGEEMKMEVKIDLKGVKIILPDSTELDAKVVLRDRDLDMAFIRPTKKPAKPMVAVNLSHRANPDVMDEMIVLGRLSKVASYAPSVLSARIAAVVHKPHTFYIPQMEGGDMGDIGTPAFTRDGQPVGVILIRILASEGASNLGAMMGNAGAMGITAVIMPADVILEASKQVADKPAAKE